MTTYDIDPYLDPTIRRFKIFKFTAHDRLNIFDSIIDNDKYTEIKWRPTIPIDNDNDINSGTSEFSHFTAYTKRAPFVIEWNEWFHHLDKSFQVLYNDPVNSLDSTAGVIDIDDNEEELIVDFETRIGNRRSGLLRDIKHFGGTLTQDDIDDLDGSGLSEFPFFPPVQDDFTKPEYFSLTTTKSGFKHYLRASNETATTTEIRDVKELTGSRVIIFDTSDATFKNNFKTGVSTVSDNIFAELEDIETHLDSEYDEATFDILGTSFLPSDKDYEIINMPAQTRFKMDGTNGGFIFEQFDSDLIEANLLSKLSSSKTDGSWIFENNDGSMKIEFDLTNSVIQLTTGSTHITLHKDGDIDIDAGTNDINMTGNVKVDGSFTEI